jgi:hypothetical protein
MQFSPTSCHFISLWSKYSPQQHSQTPSVYVPHLMSETKFHTHTEPQAYYFLFYTFRQVLEWMVASITIIHSLPNYLLNQILVCNCSYQTFALRQIFKGSVHYIYVMILHYILEMRLLHILIFLSLLLDQLPY